MEVARWRHLAMEGSGCMARERETAAMETATTEAATMETSSDGRINERGSNMGSNKAAAMENQLPRRSGVEGR